MAGSSSEEAREDLGLDAEDLADHDTGDEIGIDDGGVVVGICPFGDGDGLGGAVEQVVGGFVVGGQPLVEEDSRWRCRSGPRGRGRYLG